MKYLYLIISALIFMSCGSEPTNIKVNDIIISDTLKNVGAHAAGVAVTLRYPEIESGNTQLDEILRSAVKDFIEAPMYENDVYSKPQDMIDTVFEAYRSLVEEFPDYRMGWSFKRDAKVVYKSKNVITFDFTEEQFTGGAHPIIKKVFLSFDTKRASEISLDDIVDTSSVFFMELAEAKFREFQGIAPDADLLAEDFFVYEAGRFSLSESFGIIGEDLIFYYNPYDISPYYKGSAKFMINKKDLGKNLKKPELLN
ncbi:MAG: hypothetical protein SCALA702_15020 [Melioribacteraceae bacterium]|nr:MAG: hypothetical protein SCALA702_15020 [Melioribacteraceae bacterium]